MSVVAEGVEADTRPIGDVRWRQSVQVSGVVRAMRVRPGPGGTASLECTVVDDSGGITVIFLGRPRIAGISLGRALTLEGMVGENRGRLVILNPLYTLHAWRAGRQRSRAARRPRKLLGLAG